MRKTVIISLLCCVACNKGDNLHIFLPVRENSAVYKYVEIKHPEFRIANGYIKIPFTENSRDDLLQMLRVTQAEIYTSIENLQNMHTTRTSIEAGSYYKRRKVYINEKDGSFSVKQDEAAHPKLVWDPAHPDTRMIGPKKGFVDYPGIIATDEMKDLEGAISLNNAIIDFLKENNVKVVVSKFNFSDVIGELEWQDMGAIKNLLRAGFLKK